MLAKRRTCVMLFSDAENNELKRKPPTMPKLSKSTMDANKTHPRKSLPLYRRCRVADGTHGRIVGYTRDWWVKVAQVRRMDEWQPQQVELLD